jgi:transcriptional regulator with PAS, ATPase and Fis domain
VIPHSVLWIGPASGLEASPLAASPLVDIAWSRELADALALPLASFDCVVLHAAAPEAEAARARLRAAGARAVLDTADPARGPAPADLAAAGRPAPPSPAAPRTAPPPGMVGASVALAATLALVARAQQSGATVLLTGETGTGKEVLARAIHTGSARAAGPFVALNCAAFPDTLLESELFGHAKGAFTGADRAKDGLMALADGGTLFLDEVGETSVALQAKLLRALQEREVRPVGGTRARRVDVRVVAATNRELSGEIAHGRFRADLYWRLAVFPIRVPPLRDRREDVLALAQHFLARHGAREGRPGCRLSREAEELLLAHHWPGNVRELENEILRALALSEPFETIPAERLSERLGQLLEPLASLVCDSEPLRDSLARFEAVCLRRALDRNAGKRAETARNLGLTREGLYKKLKRHGIQ